MIFSEKVNVGKNTLQRYIELYIKPAFKGVSFLTIHVEFSQEGFRKNNPVWFFCLFQRYLLNFHYINHEALPCVLRETAQLYQAF